MKMPWVVNSLTVLIAAGAIWLTAFRETGRSAVHSARDQDFFWNGRAVTHWDSFGNKQSRGSSGKRNFTVRAEQIRDLIGIKRSRAIEELAREWAGYDTAATLRWANTLPGDIERAKTISEMLTKAEDMMTLCRVIEEEGINLSEVGQYSYSYYRVFGIALAREIGGAEAVAWFSRNMKGGGINFVMEGIVWDLSSHDLPAAVSLLDSFDDDWMWKNATMELLRRDDIDLQNKMDVLFKFAGRKNNADLLLTQLETWKYEIHEETGAFNVAIARMKANPDLPGMDQMISVAARIMGEDRPLEAFELLGDGGKASRPEIFFGIYASWMLAEKRLPTLDGPDRSEPPLEIPIELVRHATQKHELPDVGTAILNMKESVDRYQLAGSLVDRWLSISPEECGKWASSLRSGDVRDAAAERFVNYLGFANRAAAKDWADRIDDDSRRQKALDFITSRK